MNQQTILTIFIIIATNTLVFSQNINDISNSTVQIIGEKYLNKNGQTDTLKVNGTAFIYEFSVKIDTLNSIRFSKPYLVTNKHVADSIDSANLIFTLADQQGRPDYGRKLYFRVNNFKSQWIPHPLASVDLCIMPISHIINHTKINNKPIYYFPIDSEFILSSKTLESVTSIKDVLMFGYPRGVADTTNNIPIIRKGSTITPLYLNYNNKPEILIDVPVFPGSSGSPVFLYFDQYERNGNILSVVPKLALIGIATKSISYKSTGEVKVVDIPIDSKLITEFDIPMDIAICIKSELILMFENVIKK